MKIAEIIDTYIAGDWGNELPSDETPFQVSCIRGADIVPIENVDYKGIPLRYVSKKTMDKRLLSIGDIIIEKSGGSPTQSTGRVSIISEELYNTKVNIVCSNFCSAFRVKPEWNPWYVYYYFKFIYDRGVFFNYEGKTSGLKNLQMENAFSSIEINEIPRNEQDTIAEFLLEIERKVAINHHTNATFEAMAKQLYDYWFVQFDFPDVSGKPYKSSGGKMVYNETLKREIPEGWEVKMLKDITNGEMESITPVNTPNTLFKHYSIPAFDSCGSYEEELGSGILSNKNVVSSKDVLVSKLNPWTSRVIWGVEGKDIICSTEFVLLAPKNIKEKGFIYNLAKTDSFIAYCTKASTGTSHSHRRVNPEIMTLYPFPYCANVCQMFSSLTSEYAEKTMKNLEEIKKLENTKNFFLPLMMNGQVKID